MESNTSALRDTTKLAEQPSFVEHFSIEGLYGYRSVSLSSKYAATVLIARNGSGKTTLLAALDAFLRGQFTRFAGLDFESISCRIRGHSEMLILNRRDVEQLADVATNSEIAARAKSWEVEPLALVELLETGLLEPYGPDDNPTFHTIYTKLGYDRRVAKTLLEKLASVLHDINPEVHKLRETLRTALDGMEIVYLPTYRRIELSIPSPDPRAAYGRRRTILSRLGVARSGLYTTDIQFGLSDISDRLKAMYSSMLYQANQGYGNVSANIIKDLISGDYKNASNTEPPSRESLEIFFSRIKDAEREYRRGPYSVAGLLSELDMQKIYGGNIPPDAAPFLAYFLAQLNSVIKETSSAEQLVEDFIASCNRYLSGEDGSTELRGSPKIVQDSKQLTFNRKNLNVKVLSHAAGKQVPLEALSSGEKQMISLFARLYLYPGPKLVLIDEPELSLSLDWQRRILPDVLLAPTCRQVIAITHSPFIFDNDLEPFAGSLQLKIEPTEELFQKDDFQDAEDRDE